MIVTLVELDRENPKREVIKLAEHWNPKVNEHNIHEAIKRRAGFLKKTAGNFKIEIRYETMRVL